MLATKIQARRGSWSDWSSVVTPDSRCCKSKGQVISLIDGKVVDALLINRRRNRGFRSFDQLSAGAGNSYDFAYLPSFERDVKISALAHRQFNGGKHSLLEVRRFHCQFIIAGSQIKYLIKNVIVRCR